MTKPNFFILGAPKCGTTTLTAWLAEHPNVFFSPLKEPNFFNTDHHKLISFSLQEYEDLFSGAKEQHYRIGEGTTNYLYSQEAVRHITQYVENLAETRFLICVRNPIEMVFSLHNQRRKEGKEPIKNFEAVWRIQESRAKGIGIPWLVDAGSLLYGPICMLGEQLERLYTQVAPEQVHVVVLDDMKEDPKREYSRVLKFLNLPGDGRSQFPVHNVARSIPYWIARMQRVVLWIKGSLHIHKEFGMLRKLNRQLFPQGGKSSPNPELVSALREYFRDDVMKLGKILKRDLSHWLTAQTG